MASSLVQGSGLLINAKFFSVSADEAADSSNKEQLPSVLRFVDAINSIHEELSDFFHCDTGPVGSAIRDKILEALREYMALILVTSVVRHMIGLGIWLENIAVLLHSFYLYVPCAAQSESLCGCCLQYSGYEKHEGHYGQDLSILL